MSTNFARALAALNATNEAILYAKSPEELYGQVCEAAFSSGDFLATAIFLQEAQTSLLRFAAGFGEDTARLRNIEISTVAGTPGPVPDTGYQDGVIRYGVIATAFWGVVGFAAGTYIAFELAYPVLNLGLPWTSFGRRGASGRVAAT